MIRSLEFDVWGEGANWDEALADFGEALRAVYFNLVELASEGRATVDELHTKAVLTQRFMEVIAEHDKDLRRKLDWPWRRTRQHASDWQRPSSSPENSQLVSSR